MLEAIHIRSMRVRCHPSAAAAAAAADDDDDDDDEAEVLPVCHPNACVEYILAADRLFYFARLFNSPCCATIITSIYVLLI